MKDLNRSVTSVSSPATKSKRRLRSQVSATSESGSPCENAKPALVVASAGNPSCCRYRAEPMSQGFGVTKQASSCRVRKDRRRALKFSCDPRPSVPMRCAVIGFLNVFIASPITINPGSQPSGYPQPLSLRIERAMFRTAFRQVGRLCRGPAFCHRPVCPSTAHSGRRRCREDR